MEEIKTADVVIAGAGIAGVSAAYFLAVRQGIRNVIIVDDRPPLTLTSDKSSEGYRNWWPGPGNAMVRFMNRSIDLLEALAGECDNRFHMNRRGYVYLTTDTDRAQQLQLEAVQISQLGAGPLRVGEPYQPAPPHGFSNQPTGADLIAGTKQIQAIYPFISGDVQAMLHARRCGWLSAQQLGMYLLEKARESGVKLINGRVRGVDTANGQINSVLIEDGDARYPIKTTHFVIATGPHLKETGRLLDIELPVVNERHGKIAFEDTLGIIPRDVPMIIWHDPITLPWNAEDREELAADEETAWLLKALPPGLHFRPEGGPGSQTLLALWSYHIDTLETPVWPLRFDPEFAEIILRGLTCMVPDLAAYIGRMARPFIDGGYYNKTRENRPLISPLPVQGSYVFGALSGYGIMGAMAGAELLAAYVTGTVLPDYAPSFHLGRYQNPDYLALLREWEPLAGQL